MREYLFLDKARRDDLTPQCGKAFCLLTSDHLSSIWGVKIAYRNPDRDFDIPFEQVHNEPEIPTN